MGQNIARYHEEYGYHDMARNQQMDDGKVMEPPVFAAEAPSGHGLVGVGEEEVEIEHQHAGPAAQAIEGSDRVKPWGRRVHLFDPVLKEARGYADQGSM